MNKDKVKMEKYRSEIAKQYKDKLSKLENSNRELLLENSELKNKVTELDKELYRYKEILEILQKHLQLSEEELQNIINKFKTDKLISDSINSLIKVLMEIKDTNKSVE